MTDPAADIQAAERRAAAARERLTDDLHKLQIKLNPKTLARDVARSAADAGLNAARSAADAGQTAAHHGLDYARTNPTPIAGAVAATGLFLLRHRIVRLFRRGPTVKAQAKARPADLHPSVQKDQA